MKTLQENKEEIKQIIEAMPEDKMKELCSFYEVSQNSEALSSYFNRMARDFARNTKQNADYKDYGQGECRYYFKEFQEELLEDTEDEGLSKVCSKLSSGYFDYLYEVEEMLN